MGEAGEFGVCRLAFGSGGQFRKGKGDEKTVM